MPIYVTITNIFLLSLADLIRRKELGNKVYCKEQTFIPIFSWHNCLMETKEYQFKKLFVIKWKFYNKWMLRMGKLDIIKICMLVKISKVLVETNK